MEQHGNRQAFTLLNKLPAEELKQLLKEDLYRENGNRELYPMFPEKLRETQPKPRRKPGVLAKRWNMVR